MSYTPTLGLLAAETAQYAEEPNFGTFPNSPTMLWIGSDMQYSDSADMGAIKIRNLGSEDSEVRNEGCRQLRSDPRLRNPNFGIREVSCKFSGHWLGLNRQIPLDSDCSEDQWCRTISRGSRMQTRFRLNQVAARQGTESECKTARAVDSAIQRGPAQSLWQRRFCIISGTNPWIFTDPGSSGVTIGGTAFDINDLTISFNRNLQRVRAIGQSTAKYIVPSVRDITFDVTILLEATSNYSALLNGTLQTIVAPLKASTSVLTLSNAFFVKQGKSIQCKDIIMEKYSGVCESAALT